MGNRERFVGIEILLEDKSVLIVKLNIINFILCNSFFFKL